MSYGSEAVKKTRHAKQEFISTWKASRGCAWCGEKDPIVLDCDHIDPKTKDDRLRVTKKSLGRVKWGLALLSWKDLEAELEKCQVLCANCHRRKTYAERGE